MGADTTDTRPNRKTASEISLATLEDQRDRLKKMYNAIEVGAYTGDKDNVVSRIKELDIQIAKEQGNE
jgi:hypothetical protein